MREARESPRSRAHAFCIEGRRLGRPAVDAVPMHLPSSPPYAPSPHARPRALVTIWMSTLPEDRWESTAQPGQPRHHATTGLAQPGGARGLALLTDIAAVPPRGVNLRKCDDSSEPAEAACALPGAAHVRSQRQVDCELWCGAAAVTFTLPQTRRLAADGTGGGSVAGLRVSVGTSAMQIVAPRKSPITPPSTDWP